MGSKERQHRVISSVQLKAGYYVSDGHQAVRREYKIVAKFPTGEYMVEEPEEEKTDLTAEWHHNDVRR